MAQALRALINLLMTVPVNNPIKKQSGISNKTNLGIALLPKRLVFPTGRESHRCHIDHRVFCYQIL